MTRHSVRSANRDQACGRKQGFPDPKSATEAMMAMKKRKGIQRFLTIYRCRFCGKFHFGNAGFATRADKLIHKIDRAMARDRHMSAYGSQKEVDRR